MPGSNAALIPQLAATLRGTKRRADVVFRWGPDEFMILVGGTDAQELTRFAERLNQTLNELGGPARASIGYALTGPEIHTPAELVERASRMRYRNKYREAEAGASPFSTR